MTDDISMTITIRLSLLLVQYFHYAFLLAESYKPVIDYIDTQFEKYIQEEIKIHRSQNLALIDSRVHVCLYLISPVGHGLRAIDLVTMKALGKKVEFSSFEISYLIV